MYAVICFHDSHNPSRGWWSPCLADICILELCHHLLGLCTFRLPLNLQLFTVPSESCVFSRNQRHSFIHTWSILFMFELNIIMWVELLCKINIQDPSMRYHCEIETVDLRSRLLSRGWNSWSKVTIITFSFSFVLFLSTSWSLVGNQSHLTWVKRSSHKSNTTHSCQCVRYFHVSYFHASKWWSQSSASVWDF